VSAQLLETQLTEPNGNKLDAYEIEAEGEKEDVLRDLAEFQLAAVRPAPRRSCQQGSAPG
jgi:F-type H+-transporting ATPase subunit gamma